MCLTPYNNSKLGLRLPCGHCIECLKMRANVFAVRCSFEASLHSENCFLTLTYDDEHIPADKRVNKRDVQLFLKRLRKNIDFQIKYFACGEYGGHTHRPHYHLIIFGWQPSDLVQVGQDRYSSDLVSNAWKNGFVSVGLSVDSQTSKYAAKYLQKCNKEYPCFLLLSKNLGFSAFNKKWLDTGRIYYEGKSMRIPRYFLDKLDDERVNSIRSSRRKYAALSFWRSEVFDDNSVEDAEIENKIKKNRYILKNFLDK